jgi:hypothetical protein
MVMVTLRVVEPVESVLRTVKEKVPIAVGVPEIAPVAASVKPLGSVPPATDQLEDPVPPLAGNEPEYGWLTVPLKETDCGVFTWVFAVTVRTITVVAETPAASVTVMETFDVPLTLGLPLRVPSLDRTSPAGKPVPDHE